MILKLTPGWTMKVERGPDCLFVRLRGSQEGRTQEAELADLGEGLWAVLEQSFSRRMVLELDELPLLRSALIGQLLLLHRKIQDHGGMLRLCGLSPQNQQLLHTGRLETFFPHYRDREEAVMGYRPRQPR